MLHYDNAIERVQRKFLKHLNYRTHSACDSYEQSCHMHSLVPLRDRRIVRDMALLYDVCLGRGVLESTMLVGNLLHLRAPDKRTRHTVLFDVPVVRTNYLANSIRIRLPRTFNKLFSDIDLFHLSQNCFLKQISTTLAGKY